MPKLLFARPPLDATEERQVHKLAGSRHAPGDWILRARMVARSWAGERTTAIAAALGCHPQTVRERLARFNAEGIDGLGDRPGGGRKPRLSEAERGALIALARSTPPGQPVRERTGELVAEDPTQDAQWSLDALARAAHARGIRVERSQIRRILMKEGARWRHPRSWAASTDPEFAPKGPGSSRSTPPRHPARRPSAWMNSAR
jgi:transposase